MSIKANLEQIFLLEEIEQAIRLDSCELVREIKKHPIIYDNQVRRNQTKLFHAWECISAKMLPNFNSLSEDEKIATRKRLKDRWSYMRATFRRNIYSARNCHKDVNWIQEMDFLAPILARNKTLKATNNSQGGKCKNSTRKKKYQNKVTSTTATATTATTSATRPATCNTSMQLSTNIQINNSTTFITTPPSTTASTSSNAISYDSSDTDKSIIEIVSSATDSADENKVKNDTLINTFMSTSNWDSFLTSTIDPDQIFLLTLLQNYRLVPNEKREALQHKFYTFLRD